MTAEGTQANIMPYDLAVIGGGVNGCGIARDAVGRGARVLLLEADDLASGTSSASTKLIHGGLRYLEHFEFALVREALTEREILWGIAPHIIWPLRFVLPHIKGQRPQWLLRLGLFLYDHLGGRKRLPATEKVKLARHVTGGALKPELKDAFIYSDCWVDDARLVVLNARSAADRGAHIHTRCPVTALKRDGDLWQIETPEGTFAAHAIVNAGGPAVLDVLGLSGHQANRRMRLVRGSHIVVPKLFDHPNAYFFQLPDGRIFFAIPYEQDFTLIGTTDQDHQGSLRDVKASPEEIAYLCEGASRYFKKPIRPEDVVWTYSGVRPLIDDGSKKPEGATRGYSFEMSPESEGAPILSVFGGKITTFRHMAEAAVDLLSERLPALKKAHWTGRAALPGGDFAVDGVADQVAALKRDFPFLDDAWVKRLVRSYGTTAHTFLNGAKSLKDCGQHFGHGLTEREVEHLTANEWARTADDILWRRTKLGLRFSASEAVALSDYLKKDIQP